jgi:hypothetical protein
MVFTTLISFALIYLGIQINLNMNIIFTDSKTLFGESFGRNIALFTGADAAI